MTTVNPLATHLMVRVQEIALKGKNRPDFENLLARNIRRTLSTEARFLSASGRTLIELPSSEPHALSETAERLAQVSGIAAITPVRLVPSTAMEQLAEQTLAWTKHELDANPSAKTFALRVRRVDKSFPMSSSQVEFAIGAQVKKLRTDLLVKLKQPDVGVHLEIRRNLSLLYSDEVTGVSGLPLDRSQRVVCLLSGGIDSPVAAYQLMRRGIFPIFVHFHSKPFTSEASVTKVKRLAETLRKFSPYPMELWLVPLLEIQKAVRDQCSERYRTLHYRRFMMRIASELASRRNALGVVTGEAVGQVASQTLVNMGVTEENVGLPVLRPLIALDKPQIIAMAQAIGTYETSIEPHDDTCVLFAPEHPATKANPSILRAEHESLPVFELIFRALDQAEKVLI